MGKPTCFFFLSLSGPFFQQRNDPKVIWDLNLEMKTLTSLWHICWDPWSKHSSAKRVEGINTHGEVLERSNQYKREPMALLLTTRYGFCRSSASKGRMSCSFRRMIVKDRSHSVSPAGIQSPHSWSLTPCTGRGEDWRGKKWKKLWVETKTV